MPSGRDWTKWPQVSSTFLDSKRPNDSPKGHCKSHTMQKLAQVLQVRLLLVSAKCQKLNKKWYKSKTKTENKSVAQTVERLGGVPNWIQGLKHVIGAQTRLSLSSGFLCIDLILRQLSA